MKKPSCGQVLATLVFQRGFSGIKYSGVTVWNSSMWKTSYMRNMNQFINVTSLKLFVFLPLQSTVSLPSSVRSVATASLFCSHRQQPPSDSPVSTRTQTKPFSRPFPKLKRHPYPYPYPYPYPHLFNLTTAEAQPNLSSELKDYKRIKVICKCRVQIFIFSLCM